MVAVARLTRVDGFGGGGGDGVVFVMNFRGDVQLALWE